MQSLDDYLRRFQDELEKGKELNKLLEEAAEMLVLRDKVIRDKEQTILVYQEWQKALKK